jgi:hypothetical protein
VTDPDAPERSVGMLVNPFEVVAEIRAMGKGLIDQVCVGYDSFAEAHPTLA